MKKIVLTLFLIMFTALSSQATTIVSYGAGGVPLTATSGVRRVSVAGQHYGFGRNAMFHPDNVAHNSMNRMRHRVPPCRRMSNNYYNNNNYYYPNSNNAYYSAPMTPAPMVTPQVSRLDKSYTIAPKSSYTRNGITYYN